MAGVFVKVIPVDIDGKVRINIDALMRFYQPGFSAQRSALVTFRYSV